LWGAGELEDMLYQPKNDHVLFAFFGISLASRRRSRTSEIRTAVNAKNKLLRILGEDPSHQPALLRDLKDTSDPYEKDYTDFDKRPRWKGYSVIAFHPLGLEVSIARHYAYIDKVKGEWDFTRLANNAVSVDSEHKRRDRSEEELNNAAKGFWELLPRQNRATLVKNGLIRFDSIALIDDKGDSEYKCPHLYVDFHIERGPFVGFAEYLEISRHRHESLEGLKRAAIFPEELPKPGFGTIHRDRVLSLDEGLRSTLKYNSDGITIYALDDKYSYLKPTDVIGVEGAGGKDGQLLKITSTTTVTGKELLEFSEENPLLRREIERQISRELRADDMVSVTEALPIYDWQIEQNRPVV
jgi:hypothetical protein